MSHSDGGRDRDTAWTALQLPDFDATKTKTTVNASDVASIDAASMTAALADPSNESTLDKMHDVQRRSRELTTAVEIENSAGRLVGNKIRIESDIKKLQHDAIAAIRNTAPA